MAKAKEKSTRKAPQTDRQRKSASENEEPKAQVEQDQEQPKAETTQGSSPNFRADRRVDDQVAQEAERQAQLAQAREEHNRRVAPAA
jgi:hypothetical protein